MGNQVILEEQGLRDGLQTLALPVDTVQKQRWAQLLAAAGLRRLQVASFVHPKLVPQMADAEQVLAGLSLPEDVVASALVLNRKGVERAAAAGIRHLAISLSASEEHSRRNANKIIEEAKAEFGDMVDLARQEGIAVRGGIQCAFGCRFEGAIPEARVYELAEHHLAAGVDELALADSTGMGHPAQVRRMMREVLRLAGDTPVSLHLHNTENKGYANLVAALDEGVRQFDTAFGGLGGCPFIPGATGNIATEDTAHMLQQMGMDTGIDIARVAQVSAEMETLLGEPLPGLMYRILRQQSAQPAASEI